MPVAWPKAQASLMPVFLNASNKPHREYVLIGKERHDIGRPGDVGYPIRGIIRDSFLLIRNFEVARWPAGNPETGYLNTDGSPTKTQILDDRREGNDSTAWQLAFGKRPPLEMFNVELDRDCMTNLAGQPRYAQVQAELIRQMEEQLVARATRESSGTATSSTRYPYANPGEQGFYEKYLADPDGTQAGWVNATDFEPGPIGEE